MLPPSWVKTASGVYGSGDPVPDPTVSWPSVRLALVVLKLPLRANTGAFTTVRPPCWTKVPPSNNNLPPLTPSTSKLLEKLSIVPFVPMVQAFKTFRGIPKPAEFSNSVLSALLGADTWRLLTVNEAAYPETVLL